MFTELPSAARFWWASWRDCSCRPIATPWLARATLLGPSLSEYSVRVEAASEDVGFHVDVVISPCFPAFLFMCLFIYLLSHLIQGVPEMRHQKSDWPQSRILKTQKGLDSFRFRSGINLVGGLNIFMVPSPSCQTSAGNCPTRILL